MEVKRVYKFGVDAAGNNVTEGNAKMNGVLGGKGANLAEMANIGLPVPPGFTITCQTCMEYANAGNVWPEGALDTIHEYKLDLEARMGKRLGDAEDPLLVSVRSGAPMSMPGMMDTVLNLGMNDQSIKGLIKQTANPRFAWDSYRRFIQMFSNVVMGIEGDLFEKAITAKKAARGVKNDTELTAADLEELVGEFKEIFAANADADAHPELVVDGAVAFPQDPTIQLKLAIEAVFGSWNNPRAVLYRKKEKIADDLGTAVNVQSMVFGNKGDTSATGVAFTRDAATGKKVFYGDFLVNAQGEDVVAGIRNTSPIAELKTTPGLEAAGQQLEDIFGLLEDHYRDMMDIEFTIEQGKLYMLQTRVGKRTAAAALRIAIEMVDEGMIDKATAVKRVKPEQLDQLLHPQFDKKATYDVLARGLNASPGAAVGAAVFSSADAVAAKEAGKKTVLVRWETTPDDLPGMIAAEGILTSHGGKTSHAAVIARGMAAGMTWTRPDTEDNHMTKTKLLETIVMMMGGRAGEAVALDDICTGASNDIERATKLAKNMVTRWGLSDELGPVMYGSESDEVFIGRDYGHVRDYSEEVAARIDKEVRRIVEDAYARALAILKEHRDEHEALAQFLLEYEKVNEEEFLAIMKGTLTVESRRAEEAAKKAAEPVSGDALLDVQLPEGDAAAPAEEAAPEAPAEA